jgi:hypothetical protein
MKWAFFWNVTLRGLLQLLVTANVVPSSPILFTLMVGAIITPKPRSLQDPHGFTSKKTVFFIVTSKLLKFPVRSSHVSRNAHIKVHDDQKVMSTKII